MKIKKKKNSFGYFTSLNPNAGDIEKGTDFFNSTTVADTGSAVGNSSLAEENELEKKQQLFNQIKKINPNANYDNYENMSINRMLAVLNSYKRRLEKINQKEEPKMQKRNIDIEDIDYRDIYYDRDTEDFMIKGLGIGFDTEQEAVEYLKELKREEE